MRITPYEKGFAIGLEIGRRQAVRECLENEFGPLSTSTLERLEQLPLDAIKELTRKIVHAQSLKNLGLD